MTLQLTLSPELQARLEVQAASTGVPPAELAADLLAQHLPPSAAERAARFVALVEQWRAEDAANPHAAAERDEFLRALDENRMSDRPLFPPELKGVTW